MQGKERSYNGIYEGEYLNHVAFPMGGVGAGMICLEGTGTLSHVSLKHRPEVSNEPAIFSALCVKGGKNTARVLEGPVPAWKIFGPAGSGNGHGGKIYGLPRFSSCSFEAKFPFGIVRLRDDRVPLEVDVTGWSPFIPGDEDDSSLPAVGLEYTFRNPGSTPVEAVYSFHSRNFIAADREKQVVDAVEDGFILRQTGDEEAAFCAVIGDGSASVDCAWFRGGWFDNLTVVWKHVAEGACLSNPPFAEGGPSPGASIYVPLRLEPGEEKTVRLMLSWYVPGSRLSFGRAREDQAYYRPWYAERFSGVEEVSSYWRENYDGLQKATAEFSDCFYDSTLPPEVIEAVAANLSILKSPTVLREHTGRAWCWEGCRDNLGCCGGSCTHVWNYAQAMPHLFPKLERSLRQTEFNESQDERGHQNFRSALPIGPTGHGGHAASDGQLGGIMKVFRDWRISGDTDWLRSLWPEVTKSIEYCINTWDPDHKGVLEEPHHNTYDIEFWGPDGICGSIYLGALRAATVMGKELGEDVSLYEELYRKGCAYLEEELYNGEYFVQKVQWKGLKAAEPTESGHYFPEAVALLKEEGPKYQYGVGCLSDGVLGDWMARACGLGPVLDEAKVAAHVKAVHKYNFKRDLSEHVNPQRPGYALGTEGGLLVCSWPKGGRLSIPFPYSEEVWTGIEYQVASHLMMLGFVEEGLEIVRTCRDRYDGRVRNPFNEYECGHWYARAMASYAMLQGLAGVRYDAVEKVLHVAPSIPGDWRSFLSTATGYGTVGVKDGEAFVEVVRGTIEVDRIEHVPAGE